MADNFSALIVQPPASSTVLVADILDAGSAASADIVDFAPAVHTHVAADITDLDAGIPPTKWHARWQVAGIGGSTFTGVGAPNPSVSTDWGAGFASDADGTYVISETGPTSGNRHSIAWHTATAFCRIDQQPEAYVAMKTGPNATDLQGILMWPLFFGSSNPDNTTDPSHGVGFRFSTAAGDTQFMAFSRTTTTQTAATGITPAAGTHYIFRVKVLASSVEYYINDVLVQTLSAQVPAAATECVLRSTIRTTAAVTRIHWFKAADLTHA